MLFIEIFYKKNKSVKQGKILSGIPALDSQFAGLVIKSKIIVQALDDQHYKLAVSLKECIQLNSPGSYLFYI